jgi:kynurenine formamidase
VSHPRYRDLPVAPSAPPASSWGLWGPDDEVGTINLLTEERAERAARLVRRGAVFSLNWKLELPSPALFRRRSLCRHVVDLSVGTDDYYEPFYAQGSSHWDSLCHVEHPEHGYYNGRRRSDIGENGRNGVDHWARRGIAGRFVLADVAGWAEAEGRPFDAGTRVEITTAELEATLRWAGAELAGGDVLLLRTGWVGWYERQPQEVRDVLGSTDGDFATAGLSPAEETAAWLWDHEVAAIAADNPAVEAMQFDETRIDGYLHFRLLALLGMPLGEMFFLDALAADCRRTGCYEGLFTSAPLNARGGSGSPANALALL